MVYDFGQIPIRMNYNMLTRRDITIQVLEEVTGSEQPGVALGDLLKYPCIRIIQE